MLNFKDYLDLVLIVLTELYDDMIQKRSRGLVSSMG